MSTFLKPFDELPAVTELIRLYKIGVTRDNLAYYFNTSKNNVYRVLKMYCPDSKTGRKRNVGRPAGRWGDDIELEKLFVEQPVVIHKKGKYDDLINEPRREGKSYYQLCNQYKIKVKKWF